MPAELVPLASEQALTLRQPVPALVCPRQPRQSLHHCRRPCAHGAVPSVGPPGNPYDNAQPEAGWNTVRTGFLPGGSPFAPVEEAGLIFPWYLDTQFNLDRRRFWQKNNIQFGCPANSFDDKPSAILKIIK